MENEHPIKSQVVHLEATTDCHCGQGNLNQRGNEYTPPPIECSICEKIETSEHMTYGCSWTKLVWFELVGICP